MQVLKTKFEKTVHKQIDQLTGKKARSIIKINNIFLIISGVFLLSFHIEVINVMLHIKATIGLILASTFYIVPIIMKKYSYISWFNMTFHYVFFALMMTTVILSQIMFA